MSNNKLNIKLKDVPVLLEFLSNALKNVEIDLNINLANDLRIAAKCECNQSDCGTVYFQSNTEFNQELFGSHCTGTSKGFVILHIEEDGYLELEVIDYEDYPYKEELKKLECPEPVK